MSNRVCYRSLCSVCVVFAAIFCRWLHEKLLLNVVARENGMMTVCFAPLNILRDMPFKSKQLQSFRKDKCILMILRIPSFLVVLKDGVELNFLANSPVCDPLIREFYANASLKKEHIECWVRGHEFNLDIENIDVMLGFEEKNHEGFTPFKDRMLSAKSVQLYLGE